jgi:hypothetical protein
MIMMIAVAMDGNSMTNDDGVENSDREDVETVDDADVHATIDIDELLANDRNACFILLVSNKIEETDDLEQIKDYIESNIPRFSIHVRLWTPLMEACHHGKVEVVRYLLEVHGLDVNAKDKVAPKMDLSSRIPILIHLVLTLTGWQYTTGYCTSQ